MWSVPGTKALLQCVAIMGLCLRTVRIRKTLGSFAVSIWACAQYMYNRGCRFCLFVRYYMTCIFIVLRIQQLLYQDDFFNRKRIVCLFYTIINVFVFHFVFVCLFVFIVFPLYIFGCSFGLFLRRRGGGYWFQVFLGIWEGGIYENYLYIFFASAISK